MLRCFQGTYLTQFIVSVILPCEVSFACSSCFLSSDYVVKHYDHILIIKHSVTYTHNTYIIK